MHVSEFQYHSRLLDSTWFQVDLKGFHAIKCIRVATRSYSSHFKQVEFRFGNESQNGNFMLNPVIANIGPHQGVIVEFCLDYTIIGQYLGLRQYFHTYFLVGEIQITTQ